MKTVEDLIDSLRAQLRDIMGENNHTIEMQRESLRIIFMTFIAVGRQKNLPLMKDVIVEFVRLDYPHLQEDFDKLLILC